MTIKIYKSGGIDPIEVWEDYPFVPNVGDWVYTDKYLSGKVSMRAFSKDCVKIILNFN